jgi:citrate lyase beta subunit
MSLPVAWLFVPGDRPDRFAKAVAAAAGAVILDLEDAVTPDRKAEARAQVAAFLADGDRGDRLIAVRVNPVDTLAGVEDLAALLPAGAMADIVILPKTESPDMIAMVGRLLDQAGSAARLVALVESARGVAAAAELAMASPRLAGLMFGAADYAADLGQRTGAFDAAYARATLVNAAAISGLTAIDSPDFEIDDPEALTASCARARTLGFHAKAAIHPAQLAIITAAFAPDAAELAEARRLLTLSDGGASAVDGKMIDIAILRWARRIVGAAA